MKRYYGGQQRVAKPVEKITIDERVFTKRRIFFIALFLCLGIGALAYGFTHLHGSERGWQTIVPDKIGEESCCYDFTLTYEFGTTKKSARKERSSLEAAYKKLAKRAYRVFDRRAEYEEIGNLCSINRHPNEEVEVEPELYRALETCLSYEERLLFLGALTEHVEALLASDSDEALMEYDPYSNEEVMAFYRATAEYVNDPGSVSLELCGDNRVMLRVSPEYEAFAKANDIVDYIDFGWVRNAFICDYLADELTKQGFEHGILQSYDGFVRNFCKGDKAFRYALTFAVNGTAYSAGEMAYHGSMSFVWFHDYPASRAESEYRIMALADGKKRHTYLGTDGLPESALADMLCWSQKRSCGEVAVLMARYYISDSYDSEKAVSEADQKGIGLLTCTDGDLFCTDAQMEFPCLEDYERVTFRLKR